MNERLLIKPVNMNTHLRACRTLLPFLQHLLSLLKMPLKLQVIQEETKNEKKRGGHRIRLIAIGLGACPSAIVEKIAVSCL